MHHFSTLVEFEQLGLIPVERKASCKCENASYYELYDSYLRRGKYIVRYMFYTLSAVKRVTRSTASQAVCSHQPESRIGSSEDMQTLREEAGKEIVLTDGSFSQEEAPEPPSAVTVTTCTDLHGNRSRHIARAQESRLLCLPQRRLLLLAHNPELLSHSLLSDCEEYQIPLRSLTFLMCRRKPTSCRR